MAELWHTVNSINRKQSRVYLEVDSSVVALVVVSLVDFFLPLASLVVVLVSLVVDLASLPEHPPGVPLQEASEPFSVAPLAATCDGLFSLGCFARSVLVDISGERCALKS